MHSNDEVSDYLNCYLSPDLEADFAVMLNGAWGAGKTHFVKAFFREREEKAKSADPLQPLSHLYASLYGVRSISEITDQFFAQAHPALSSKAARLLGTVLSRTLNGIAGTEVNSGSDNRSVIQDMVLKLDGRVLIFDDLERCAMPLTDVMGFINAYVEHDSLKVIVIANEDDIPQEQKTEYSQKKEKLIGKTLRVTSDPNIVLDSLVRKLSNPAVIDTIIRETDPLLRTFVASGKQNFRSLRSVLSDFERLVSATDQRLQSAPQAMTRLLLFMMATGLEFRSGDLSAAEISALPDTLRSGAIRLVTKKEKTPAISKVEKLETTYSDVDWRDAVVPPVALAKLFETGIVDVTLINEHLARHPLVVGYSETPPWRQLWSWSELPRSQYLKARNELLDQLKNRDLTNPGVVLHAAGIVLGVEAFGDHLLGDGVDIVTFFEKYVDDLLVTGKLEPQRNLFGPMGGSYAGLGYGSKDSSEFRKIYLFVKAATSSSFSDHMREIASTYVDRISRDPKVYSSLHEYGVDNGNYADAPFLHYIDANNFAKLVIQDSAPDGRLLSSLLARYELEEHNNALTEEYGWLKTLRASLEAIAAAAQPPHKHLLELRIKYYFDKIDGFVRAGEIKAAASS